MNMQVPVSSLRISMSDIAADWVRRAEQRDLTIGILGLGYVGLPLAEAFVKNGFKVLGFDIDKTKIDAIENNTSYIKHIDDARIQVLNETGRLGVTTDFDRLKEVDSVLLCVPTPLNQYREPDLTYVTATCEMIGPRLVRGQLIVLESTTWPGTSEEVMVPILERLSGMKAHEDFAIAYSPEREDPGNPNFSTTSIPKVVGANTDDERRMAVSMYGEITQTVPVKDLKTAEAVKLMENIYRLVNIALVNELQEVFGAMDIDVWDVVDAAKTKPFGFQAFYPGPGLGGHCIPIDPFYLTWKARQFGKSTRFIELAGEVTQNLPRLAVEAVGSALNSRLQKAISGSKVLVLGLSYKKNIDDLRESPSIHLIDMLTERGAMVDYHDPYIPFTGDSLDHPEIANMESVALTSENLAQYDCALIATDHDNVDYERVLRSVPLVVDTRNATKHLAELYADKIVKA
jgi:UDP-N-acetyl-D-glucosamine dehydrogenase